MKKLILLFIGSIILFSLWKCVFFPSKDSTSSSENFPIPSSSSDTTSKEPNESDAVLKSSNSMRESLSSSSSTSDEPFSTDESNDYKSEELIDTTAQKFFSVPENLAYFKIYLEILASYVYEPCEMSGLTSHQIIDPTIFMCSRNSLIIDNSNGIITLKESDVENWGKKLFGTTIDFNQIDEQRPYAFFMQYDNANHIISAHSFSDIIAVRGYGVDSDNVQIQINGTTIYVIAPILKIEDRGIWENYHVLRYTFEFRDAETDAPYCLLQSVELCS